jgi:hypothetical protein
VENVNPANRGSEFSSQKNINAGKLGPREVVHVTKAQRYKSFKYYWFLSSFVAPFALYQLAKTIGELKNRNITQFHPKFASRIRAEKIRAISTWALAIIPIVGNIIALIWDLRAKGKK